jgi:outer membrane cobalamin receptor
LSEAFETNASVDASFTDAVTGTRQIHMLGLAGKYTQLLVDNLPGPRGLNVVQGMSFIPGPWIESIYISKGVGTVASGYESFTGQINVAHRNAETAEPFHLNLFYGMGGRTEFNHVSRHDVSRRWTTVVMTHGEVWQQENDRNNDGFLDMPLQEDFVVRNEWRFIGDRGMRANIALSAVDMDREGGMIGDVATPRWTMDTDVQRAEMQAKVGYVLPGKEGRSWGSQWSLSTHRQQHQFGVRTYDGIQNTFRGKILRSGFMGSPDWAFSVGMSYLYDDFDESGSWTALAVPEDVPTTDSLARTESVPGAFLETTWSGHPRATVVSGLRVDRHNLWGTVVTPRLHARWSVTENTSFKMVAGTGFRTPNVLMEELGVWASNRVWHIANLEPERGWNAGINLTSKFKLGHRDADFALDGYWTEFQNRAVVDLDQDPHAVHVYNLDDRESRSLTAQGELGWSVHRRVDMRLAYRFVHATTQRLDAETAGTLLDPYVPKHRAFTQWSYASKANDQGGQWTGDLTVQWVGPQRIPRPNEMFDGRNAATLEDDFVVVNGQVSRTFKPGTDLYLGVENILNFRQANPIVASDLALDYTSQDFENNMDASLVYAPIFGRMVYVGARVTLGESGVSRASSP